MKRFLVVVSALLISIPLMLTNNAPVSAQADDGPMIGTEAISKQVNILVGSDYATNNLQGYEIMKSTELGSQKLLTVKVPDTNQSMDDVIREISQMPGVIFVEEDRLIKQEYVPKDPGYSYQWFHNQIKTPDAWNQTQGSENITVAVIDGSIDTSHPDLRGKIVAPYNTLTNSSTLPYPDVHGTHVAGIIAASMDNGIGGTGVAPHVKIMPINVFDGEYAESSDLIEAINYAIEHHVNIINMSLGDYGYSAIENAAIQAAYQNGILIVAAAGNDSREEPSYPAAYDNVISVSSVDESGQASWFSNYGSTIDIAAPGENIFSTVPGNSYQYLSGTSMASPVVAGVAALVWSINPLLTRKQVEESVLKTADDLGDPGKDIEYGYGLVNAKRAINYFTPPPVVKGDWKFEQNNWYYYVDGVMKTGWILDGNKWYFLSQEPNTLGQMKTGWFSVNGKWYFFNPSGDMKTGWLASGEYWYYLDARNGDMKTGWLQLADKWYFLYPNGIMATDWNQISSKWYYFYTAGNMAANTTIASYKLGSDGAWIH